MKAELDSHANMMVFGEQCYIFDAVHQRHCDVQPFDPTIGLATQVPIVDAALAYDCPYSDKTFILVAKNVLYVKSLDHHLIPPFIMRESGVTVNDIPKIHIKEPSNEDHSIIIEDFDLHIPLQLDGIFSYFETRSPTDDEISHCDKILITPDSSSWDPYSEHYAQNEESFIDWEGNITTQSKPNKEMIDGLSDASQKYEIACNHVIQNAFISDKVRKEMNKSTCNCEQDIVSKVNENLELSKMKMSIGSTSPYISESRLLFCSTIDLEDDTTQLKNGDGKCSSTKVNNPSSVSPEFLSRIWNIDSSLAEKTLAQNTHLNRR